MENKFEIVINSNATALVKKQDRQISLVNNILATRSLTDLLYDRNRIAKAIDLAINARYNLDPFFDPYEIKFVNKEALIEEIFIDLKTAENDKYLKSLFSVEVPKNKIASRSSRYYSIKDYAIRFLLSMLLSEKITFSENIFGGKSEIFFVEDGALYENERKRFQSLQNSMLLSGSFGWIVYIDIRSYYDSIKLEILLEIIAKKLSVGESDPIIQLAKTYFSNITIGCWCDNYLQNIYFNDLDAVLNAHGWAYYRMTDDFRIFCKSKEEAELALQIIKSELEKLKLSININKLFVLKPMTSLERFSADKDDYENAQFSAILELSKVSEYPVENIFNLSRTSEGWEWLSHKYENQFPRKFTYKDELLEKTGFEINNTDVKDIILDLEQKKAFSLEDYDTLVQIIFNTYLSYQFKRRVIRLLLSHIYIDNILPEIEAVFTEILKRLASDFSSNSAGFLSSEFLRFLFLDQSVTPDSTFIFKHNKGIWNWFYQMIISNNYKSSYLLKMPRYIIEHNLFVVNHSTLGNLLVNENFWSKVIDREAELKKPDLKYKYSYNLNTIYFLDGMFNKSDLINLKRADYFFKKEEYTKALEYFLVLLKKDDLNNRLFEIAYCYNENKEYVFALKYYTDYISANKSSGAYNNRALIYQNLKRYDEALADFEAAINIEESVLYLQNRASCFIELSLFDSALLDLNRAIQIKEANDLETHTYIYRKRAFVKKQLGDIQGAIEEIKHYCKLHYSANPDTTARFIEELLEGKLEY